MVDHGGVAVKLSNVTVARTSSTKTATDDETLWALHRPAASGRRFSSRSAAGAFSKHSTQFTHPPASPPHAASHRRQ